MTTLLRTNPAALFAIFETVSSDALARDEEFLNNSFNPAFILVQSKRRLKLDKYSTAMGYFLFQGDTHRHRWACNSWSSFKRNITATEFEWSVREPLSHALTRVQLHDLDMSFLPTFWLGAKKIVAKLDADLITHSLRALEIDVCRVALDNLQIDSNAFRDLLLCISQILRISSRDFWEAMHTTPPTVWVDQFIRSKALKRLLREASAEDSEETKELLRDLFSWVTPFVSSIKPAQLAPASRALIDFMWHEIQDTQLAHYVKHFCSETGVKLLLEALHVASVDQTSREARSGILALLDLTQSHALTIVSLMNKSPDFTEQGAKLLSQAIALEVQCLNNDRNLLSHDRSPPSEYYAIHSQIWEEFNKALKPDNLPLIKSYLVGVQSLIGTECFKIRQNRPEAADLERFNEALEAANGMIADGLERINEFDAIELHSIFEETDSANALVSQLFSSDHSVRSAAVDIFKLIHGKAARKEAFDDAVRTHFENIMNAFSISLRRIAWKATFTPTPSMLNFLKDILDVLCNSSSGMLRGVTMSVEAKAAASAFWEAVWRELQTIFWSTEAWSTMGHDKQMMTRFCQDVMEFAGMLFDQFAVFTGATTSGLTEDSDKRRAGQALIEHPRSTLPLMVKFLRLRDEFLNSKSTFLVCNVLRRLKQYDTMAEQNTLQDIEAAINGNTRTALSSNQKAELHRALEEHCGKQIAFEQPEIKVEGEVKKLRTGRIDLDSWQSKAQARDTNGTTATSRPSGQAVKGAIGRPDRSFTSNRGQSPLLHTFKRNESKSDPSEHLRKRQEEMAAKKKRDAEAVARAKAKMGGSALSGLGVAAKDHSAPKEDNVMVSEGSSSEDSEDDLDQMLFGESTKSTGTAEEEGKHKEAKAKKKQQARHVGPVKKQRLVRSARDMRARLVPDLSPLHGHILGWDPNHTGEFPPNASAKDYASVLSKFRDPHEYESTFRPLLLLEAWNNFLKAKDENIARPLEMKIINRSSVDAFAEVSATVDQKEQTRDTIEGDLFLVSKTSKLSDGDREPKCLARVAKVVRKKTHVEILYRVLPGSAMTQVLNPNSKAFFLKIMSLIPLEREFGPLHALTYYDLCEEIIQARPSPLLQYKDETLEPLMQNYIVNKAQAKAIKSALDNDAFTLIQGPPGSGKTKTIIATVGALLTNTNRGPISSTASNGANMQSTPMSKKILVCAPSNAAVDELVMRLKEGVRTTDGYNRTISVVRIGRSTAMNANVQDVALETLVDKRLNVASKGKAEEETSKLMQQHKDTSEKLRQARQRLDEQDTSENRRSMEEHKKQKQLLGQKIDLAKDNEGAQNRQAEQNRRTVQQEIIQEAHVICATLSGSGHEMFQSLNVEFETVIIDEAAQCVELSALIPLKYGCAKCVLVGDPQQLPPTVFSREASKFKYEQSLFVRMQSNNPQSVHLLDTQYRMHPSISSFPRQAFYEGRLQDGPDMVKLRTRPWHASSITGPFQFFNVQGQHSSAPRGHSLVNHAEIRVGIQLYRRLITDFNEDFSRKVGIITPYKSQLRELKDRFRSEFGDRITEDIEFNTTDAFQGRESEIIIFSCVRASPSGGIGFLQDIRRMNVGLTRAKSSLWVLGNSQSLMRGEYWGKLIDHAKKSRHFVEGNLEALLNRPLPKEYKVNAPSAGEKMPQYLDYDEEAEHKIPHRSVEAGEKDDPMDVDENHKQSFPSESEAGAATSRRASSYNSSDQTSSAKRKRDGDPSDKISKPRLSTPVSSGKSTPVLEDSKMHDAPSETDNPADQRREEKVEAANTKKASDAPAKKSQTKKKPPSIFMPAKPRR